MASTPLQLSPRPTRHRGSVNSGVKSKKGQVLTGVALMVHMTEFYMFTEYVPGTTQFVNSDTIVVINSSCP